MAQHITETTHQGPEASRRRQGPPHPAALIIGVVIIVISLAPLLLSVLDPTGRGLGVVATPLVGVFGALLGALIATGRQGRRRIGLSLLLGISPIFLLHKPMRAIVFMRESLQALREHGRSLLAVAVLIVPGLLILAKPVIAPVTYTPCSSSSSTSGDPASEMPAELRAMLALAQSQGRELPPHLQGLVSSSESSRRPHTLTSETHMYFLIPGGAVVLLSLLMLLLPGGLRRPAEAHLVVPQATWSQR